MPTFSVDLLPDQYGTFDPTFLWTADGAPTDLSSATAAQMMVFADPCDKVPALSISLVANAAGSIVLGGALGTIQIKVNPGKAAALYTTNPVKPRYDLRISFADGTKRVVMGGQFLVQLGQVRP